MNSKLYRLVYCSRNRIAGTGPEVNIALEKILASARVKNSRKDVTGALLYNDGNFAQILEGPLQSVEEIFETIQCDPRHSEVTVVHSGPCDVRLFAEWSMAFAGTGPIDRQSVATAAFNSAFANPAAGGEKILSLLQELIVQENDWILLEA